MAAAKLIGGRRTQGEAKTCTKVSSESAKAGDKNPGVCTPSSPTLGQLLPLLSPVLRGLLLEQSSEQQEGRLTNGDAQNEAGIMGSSVQPGTWYGGGAITHPLFREKLIGGGG